MFEFGSNASAGIVTSTCTRSGICTLHFPDLESTWLATTDRLGKIMKTALLLQIEAWISAHRPILVIIDSIAAVFDGEAIARRKRALFSEFYEALPIKLWKTKMSKSFVQEDEAGSLGTTDVLPDLFQVLAMKHDEIAEKLDVAGLVRRCSIADRSVARHRCPIPPHPFGGEKSR